MLAFAISADLVSPVADGHPALGGTVQLPSPISTAMPYFPHPDGPPPKPYTLAAWNVQCASGTGAGSCTPSPPSVFKAAGVYDPVDGFIYYFGGTNSIAGTTNSSFLWYNSSWFRYTPNPAPLSRSNATMVWDIKDTSALLFGGWVSTSGGFYRNDTWTYSGTNGWIQLHPPTGPSARAGYQMVYVPQNGSFGGYALLFGGFTGGARYLSDTWEFNNGVWTNITATAGTPPTARTEAGIAYDSVDSYVVMFGGLTSTGLVNSTYEFSPVTSQWTQLYANGSSVAHAGPKAIMDPEMTMDPNEGAVYLNSGSTGSLKNATSQVVITDRRTSYFVGGQWTNYTSGIATHTTALGHTNPFPTYGAVFTYSAADRVIYQIGGRVQNVGVSNGTIQLGRFATVTIAPNVGELRVGQTVKIWSNASNMVAPYTTNYTNLPTGCSSSNATLITCVPSGAGVFIVNTNVVDSVGDTASALPPVRIVVDGVSQANVTLALTSYASTPGSLFWGGDDQGSHTNLTADATEEGYLLQTPLKLIRQEGTLEGVDVANSKWYAKGGILQGAFPATFTSNLTEAAAWCRVLKCVSIFDAPALENNTSATEAVINYERNTIGFSPNYWALGNEPQGWMQYPLQFYQFNTSYVRAPTAIQYGPLAQHLTTALQAAYPGISVISLQSASCGSNGFLLNTTKLLTSSLQAIACHLYSGGGHGLNLTSSMLSNRNITRIGQGFAQARAGLLTQCPSCTNVPIFVNEYNSAYNNLFCNYQVGWPEVPFLAGSASYAMLYNVSNFGLFSIDYGPSCFDSLFGPNVVPHPAYYLYSYIFDHLHLGSVYNTTYSGPFNGLYGIETVNSTGSSLMMTNANTSVSVRVSAFTGFATGAGATVYIGNTSGWFVTAYGAGTVPSSFLLQPESVLLINVAAGPGPNYINPGLPHFPTVTLPSACGAFCPTWYSQLGRSPVQLLTSVLLMAVGGTLVILARRTRVTLAGGLGIAIGIALLVL